MHNLRHLSYIVEAARLGSITHASRLLRVSQPAISSAIRVYEEEFNIRIFVRNPSKGLALTPSGRNFVNKARELLEDASDFEKLFKKTEDDPLSGRLELACYASPAPLIVPTMIKEFSEEHPGVEVGLQEGNMEQVATYLKNGTADIGLTYDIYLDNDIMIDQIAPLKPFVVVSSENPIAKKKKISLKTLVNEPLILLDSPGMKEFYYNIFGLYNIKPRVLHRPKTYEMVRGLLAAGNGYAIALVKIKNDRSYDGRTLVNVELEEATPSVNLVFASLKGYRLSRLASAFLKECKENIQNLATGSVGRD